MAGLVIGLWMGFVVVVPVIVVLKVLAIKVQSPANA